jgi:hypothetical protein
MMVAQVENPMTIVEELAESARLLERIAWNSPPTIDQLQAAARRVNAALARYDADQAKLKAAWGGPCPTISEDGA